MIRLAGEAMGTRFELVLADQEEPARLRAVGEAALAEITACHDLLNRFAPGSLVHRLAATPAGTPLAIDRNTFQLFEDLLEVWRESGGAFDPALGGGMERLTLDPRASTVVPGRPGITLDFGAIAKGHALDLAARVLRDHGIQSAFLHGGTSSAIGLGSAPGPGGLAWEIEIAGTRDRVTLRDQALSVSAAWEGNPHPTVDPRTGIPVPVPRRAVVTGPSARLADAWSTAALVLGARPPGLGAGWTVKLSR